MAEEAPVFQYNKLLHRDNTIRQNSRAIYQESKEWLLIQCQNLTAPEHIDRRSRCDSGLWYS